VNYKINFKVVYVLISTMFSMPSLSDIVAGGYRTTAGFSDKKVAAQFISMGAYSLDSFVLDSNTGQYYALMNGVLGRFDLSKQEYLGEVDVKRWPAEYKDKAISEINKHPFTHGKRGAELYDQYSSHTGTGSDANVGCLGEKPLRYGDVDGNGLKEIVLYLSEFDQKSDWVIFSPKKEKIIFSMRWQAKDLYKGDELAYYQYPSLENQNSSQNRGFQVYAKAFLGDFNKDKIPDILVWRKRFESLATGASKKGFELKGEHFEHYSLVDGEYQPQVTIPLQIKDWLADAELTWSKGYPSKSECEEQEGQLIPEMHDPLLNDPDVLK
jgi:hypothetical protein